MRALVRGIFEAPAIDPQLRAEVRAELRARGPEVMHAELAAVDPVAAGRIQPRDPQRIGRALEVYRQTGIPISTLQAAHGFGERRYALAAVAFDWPRDVLATRLAARARAMYAGGLLEEVEACLARGIGPGAPGLATIGYKEAVRHLAGELDLEAAIEATSVATRQYAKRQRNWFRHEPEVTWVSPEETAESVLALLRGRRGPS